MLMIDDPYTAVFPTSTREGNPGQISQPMTPWRDSLAKEILDGFSIFYK
jgi:hypothetical protein